MKKTTLATVKKELSKYGKIESIEKAITTNSIYINVICRYEDGVEYPITCRVSDHFKSLNNVEVEAVLKSGKVDKKTFAEHKSYLFKELIWRFEEFFKSEKLKKY